MIKLLRANLLRAIKSKTLWSWLIAYAFYALALPIFIKINAVGSEEMPQGISDLLFSMNYGMDGFPLQGVGVAIVTSIILGADFHNGTLRNKIILGESRNKIYLSNLLTIMIVSVAFNVVYMLFFFCISMPLFGGFISPATTILWIIVDGTLMMLAYSSITTLIIMSTKHSTASIITAFVLLFVAMFVCMMCDSIISAQEFIPSLDLNEMGEVVETVIRNPRYPSPAKRAFLQFVIDLFPSGQSMQISGGEYTHTWQMMLYSLGIIGATSGAGILAFNKSNLK